MMMNKRLLRQAGKSNGYVAGCVAFQWAALLCNIFVIHRLALFLQDLQGHLPQLVLTLLLCIVLRAMGSYAAAQMSFQASKRIKKTLRQQVFRKLLRLGPGYGERVSTAQVLQLSTEGAEQIETYFSGYLPQFFYSMLAPITLFFALLRVSPKAALVLLICVPLIPMSIIAVQRFAKRLLADYWDEYTNMGDHFLENIQGLTTLKIYQADERKHRETNAQAERFRRITMKVLTMQLNSITIMDLVAYGGAAAGALIAVSEYRAGRIALGGGLFIVLAAAEFFIPLRQLGSFFHIAMNGMAASDKIFALLDLPEPPEKHLAFPADPQEITIENLHFRYTPEREILKGVSMRFPRGSFTAIVGESGCGKSTIAALLTAAQPDPQGSITVDGLPLGEIREASLLGQIALVEHNSRLFKGSVRDNLQLGNPNASDATMIAVLKDVQLWDCLDTQLEEAGSNFSGGQRQRLALARAMLSGRSVYIFDEATSNIDVESEDIILALIHKLAQEHTVIMISHRLANAVPAHRIYVMAQGRVVEEGTHAQLLGTAGAYAALWQQQQRLEQYRAERSPL